MSTITIKGSFDAPGTNGATIEVYHPNPNGYEYKKTFDSNFTVTLSDLTAGDTYFIDPTGFTTNNFTLDIDGDIGAAVSLQYTGFFTDGFTIDTK